MSTSTPKFITGARFMDKVCIVTGDSSGLGRAIALAFAAQGPRLVVCADLKLSPASTFMAEEAGTPTHEVIRARYGPGKAMFIQTNLTIRAEVEDLVKTSVQVADRLDV